MPSIGKIRMFGASIFMLSTLGILDIFFKIYGTTNSQLDAPGLWGGQLGKILTMPLLYLFDTYVSLIFLTAILIISILIIFDTKLSTRILCLPFFKNIWNFFKKKKNIPEIKITDHTAKSEVATTTTPQESIKSEKSAAEIASSAIRRGGGKDSKGTENSEESFFNFSKNSKKTGTGNYNPPPLSLLEEDKGKPSTGDIKANANIIKRTLANFGIEVEMDEITVGPTITRYALKPAEGVKLSKIVRLQNDLALALAAHPIRIEAPIPGKSLVGIEIPNRTKSIVGLATLLSDEQFKNAIKPLTIALGRGISGKASFANLAKMPHCLIAGTTGAGKSVMIHSIITSLLYKNGPEDLKLIMIDPKRVELTLYNKIPHLLTPVITNAKNCILALKWAAKEMDRRYDILESETVRDIDSYHKNVYEVKMKSQLQRSDLKNSERSNLGNDEKLEKLDRLPYIVIIIDELADIMSTYPRELEAAIVRLAQMSRAVGIHLILSTQRPEVNVITGLIKANIPARIALRVSSQIDSRTILDTGGAEKLLGAGDILYSSGESQPERIQSAYISEGEVKGVVKYLIDEYEDEILEEISLAAGSISRDKTIFESTLGNHGGKDDFEEEDDMYEEARACVLEAKKASTSYLQRKLGLGYARAARLMDKLEERGVIGPSDGAKAREIFGLGQNQNETVNANVDVSKEENKNEEMPTSI